MRVVFIGQLQYSREWRVCPVLTSETADWAVSRNVSARCARNPIVLRQPETSPPDVGMEASAMLPTNLTVSSLPVRQWLALPTGLAEEWSPSSACHTQQQRSACGAWARFLREVLNRLVTITTLMSV